MKKVALIITSLFFLLILHSCLVVSIHPIGTVHERLFDRDLLGVWPEGKSFYQFQSMGDSLYYLQIYGPGLLEEGRSDTLHFEVGLYEVGEYLFLDYYPYGDDDRSSHLLYKNYLPVHTFVKLVKHDAAHIDLFYFDYERLRTLFDQNRIRLRHEEVKDATILTDGTEEIRRFVKKYAGDPDAFDGKTELRKRR